MAQINLRESLYGKLGYAAKIGRRKDPDAGDRIAAREQPEVSEVGKIRYTSSPLSPVQRPRFIASVSFAVCLMRLKVTASTLLRLNFQISIFDLHHLEFNSKYSRLIFIMKLHFSHKRSNNGSYSLHCQITSVRFILLRLKCRRNEAIVYVRFLILQREHLQLMLQITLGA